MILQLNPPLPMETSRGGGLAHFMIDYGPETHLLWVVFLDADGACWTVPNPEVRLQANWSMQRRPTQKPFQKPFPIMVPVPSAETNTASGPELNGHDKSPLMPLPEAMAKSWDGGMFSEP